MPGMGEENTCFPIVRMKEVAAFYIIGKIRKKLDENGSISEE